MGIDHIASKSRKRCRPLEHTGPERTVRFEAELPACLLVAVLDGDGDIRLREHARALLRPLDEEHGAGRQQVANAEPFDFTRIAQPIEIQVKYMQSGSFVWLDQRVGRTANRAGDSQ